MNATGFDGNTTFGANQSLVVNDSRPTDILCDVIFYVILTLGIPGNILSAIVWLRRRGAGKNSSAVYLAAIAVNDLIYLTRIVVRRLGSTYRAEHLAWLWRGLGESARILEPLLVLSFSIERLFAILRPLQANVYCTPCRALKTVIGLLLLSWAAKGLRHLLESVTGVRVVIDVYIVLFNVLVPVFVLLINVVVVHQVRRKSNDAAAASLGRQPSLQQQQQHQKHQTTLAVPTAMLLATSLIYVLLCTTCSIIYILTRWLPLDNGRVIRQVAFAWRDVIYAYNVFVYVITGKTFRLELRKLFCCRSSSAAVRSSRRDQAVAGITSV